MVDVNQRNQMTIEPPAVHKPAMAAELQKRLVDAFAALSDPVLQRRIIEFIESLAAEGR